MSLDVMISTSPHFRHSNTLQYLPDISVANIVYGVTG